MLDRESIHSFVASPLRRTSLSGLRRIFPSLSAGSPPMLWRWVSLNLSMGQHRPSPKPECFKQPSGRADRMGLARNTAREPGERTPPCIDRPLCVKEKHSKQERRNKSNKFITTRPKRSEHDKRRPVVRRSAVEYHPPPQSPNRACVTTAALDMGQSEGRHGGRTS